MILLLVVVVLVLLPILTVTRFEDYGFGIRTRITFGIIKLGAAVYFSLSYFGRINHIEITSQNLLFPVLYGLAGLSLIVKAAKDKKQLAKG